MARLKSKSLTEKEEVIWERGPLFVREIVDLLPDPKPHQNTVSTFVRGLEQKGFLDHEAFGGAHRYFAAVKKSDYRGSKIGSLLRNYFDNSSRSLVSALISEEKLSADDLRELLDLIESEPEKQ